MSASLFWRPTKGGKAINGGGPLRDLLETAFEQEFPIKLRKSHIPVLKALANVGSLGFSTSLTTIIDAIADHDEIEIWAEY